MYVVSKLERLECCTNRINQNIHAGVIKMSQIQQKSFTCMKSYFVSIIVTSAIALSKFRTPYYLLFVTKNQFITYTNIATIKYNCYDNIACSYGLPQIRHAINSRATTNNMLSEYTFGYCICTCMHHMWV